MDKERIISKIPIATTALLESANIGQMWRMWTEWTAAGQSLTSWVLVNLALVLWLIFYRETMEEGSECRKWAVRSTAAGICINGFVILSVILLRYFL